MLRKHSNCLPVERERLMNIKMEMEILEFGIPKKNWKLTYLPTYVDWWTCTLLTYFISLLVAQR